MTPPFSRTLPALLDEQALLHGDAIAVIADGREHSYTDLSDRVRQVAASLRANGIRRGDRIGILLGNHIEWLEICFGALASGAVVVPISTWSKPAELEFILSDAEIRCLFAAATIGKQDFALTLGALLAQLSTLETLVIVGEAPADLDCQRYADLFCGSSIDLPSGDGPSAADDALILYTSGSTSKPKAVRLAHYGLVENGFNIGERMALGHADRVFASIPLFWAYGAANALPATFSHGAALVLQDRFEPGGALSLIEQHRCTAIYTLPTMTAALVQHADFNPERTHSLRTGLTIGTAQDVITAANILGAHAICNVYGSSETYGNCCVTPSDWPLERRAACQGPPLPGVSLRLVDHEIQVRGYLTPGYGGQSAVHNAAVFTSDGWYRTGDMGHLTDEGDVVFAGRNSEMIKRAGINVSPAEVEEVLARHDAVMQAGVVGIPDKAKDEAIIAFVVAAKGVSEADLMAHCRLVASSYKVPDRIEFRDALPITATGKLLRQSLKEDAMRLKAREVTHAA